MSTLLNLKYFCFEYELNLKMSAVFKAILLVHFSWCIEWFVCAFILPQLIQCKADTNASNEHGNTPLHYACFWGHDLVAEVSLCLPLLAII